jgi:hypothetical protein
MPTPPSIREVLLKLIADLEGKRQGGNLQQGTLLHAAKDQLVPVSAIRTWNRLC